MSDARERLLAALRAGLRDAEVPPLPPPEVPRTVPVAERLARFTAMLSKVGGVVEHVPDRASAGVRVGALLAEAGARSLAISDSPWLAPVCAALPRDLRVLPWDAPRDELLAADAGLTSAQHAIAETGTLVLRSVDERHRLASLLPSLHIAVLPTAALVGSLAEALALQAHDGGVGSRTVTFVTGPSRTADIELQLVVGVHGPKRLHVVLCDA